MQRQDLQTDHGNENKKEGASMTIWTGDLDYGSGDVLRIAKLRLHEGSLIVAGTSVSSAGHWGFEASLNDRGPAGDFRYEAQRLVAQEHGVMSDPFSLAMTVAEEDSELFVVREWRELGNAFPFEGTHSTLSKYRKVPGAVCAPSTGRQPVSPYGVIVLLVQNLAVSQESLCL
ncbi:hypothetical protein [Cupriavidus sp. 8B]